AAGGGGFLQWPRNRGLHLQQGQAGRTGGTATSDGTTTGHGNPLQPSRPRRRSVLWYESFLHFKTSTYGGDPDQHAVPGAADRRRHQWQHRHQCLQQPDLILF
uniref:Uncharacterized protein n=1 Tax=Triticum urartu TaxID=4572 RepID=A0A8R7VKB7_TRIUA